MVSGKVSIQGEMLKPKAGLQHAERIRLFVDTTSELLDLLNLSLRTNHFETNHSAFPVWPMVVAPL